MGSFHVSREDFAKAKEHNDTMKPEPTNAPNIAASSDEDLEKLLAFAVGIIAADLTRLEWNRTNGNGRALYPEEARIVTGYVRELSAVRRTQQAEEKKAKSEGLELEQLLEAVAKLPEVQKAVKAKA